MFSLVAMFLHLSAPFAVFAVLFTMYFPRLNFLECVSMAVPVGITLSAWVALLIKSIVPTG
jgi:hypothetical protein